ncbi:ZIP family metal transporter [Roseinatronobacter bogoriensis]|uniref:ZIP family metal transporter n=1 Tax=Roseinatronobacter bogoriensis subsp. barguzinensis TaxID=441209 RepID=A0A2K8KAI3_9RHOB|nr:MULTISPECIES: ZIP family metal transporter [Rhodobaca]ATX65986.1 ZIP family metal transporter [Rhodobaca barguzinensis]MBB4208020.1 zinc transporter ZupT [Rhodobaca bogoriensis DSM 18756]TDW38659.1 zinc transporter ZupT [Rhodobaca barguzinensis]TDY69302.1 zinc transporter ZupT [Rhodobaca bogoriensis DSM 18756]
MSDPTVLLVLIAAAITAIATGLGALPLLALREVTPRALAYGNAVAAGLMLAATFSLVVEGFEFSGPRTILGLLLGLGGIWLAKMYLDGKDDVSIANTNGADALKILLIMGVMTVHSAAEGVGVGVAYGSGRELGDFITIAIALHNVPEGLAIALVMVPRGASVAKAGWWAILSSAPQPLLAVPAFLFVLAFAPVLPVGLGLAAGAMLWMIFSELLPEATEGVESANVGVIVTLAFTAMMGVTLVLG